jgi:uncharacterized protein
MEFEWDEEKARANMAKHGVSFVAGRLVFFDLGHIEEIDDSIFYGEERWKAVGLVTGRLLAVIYTQRDDKVRIISARRATRHEQQNYYQQNGS